MDLLNLHQPWDCERFPKSKTICYGGGGGGGNPVKKVVKTVADKTGYTGSDLDKGAQEVGKGVTHNVNQVTEGTKAVVKGAEKAVTDVGKGVAHGVNQVMTPVAQGLSHASGQVLKGIDHNLKQIGTGAQMLGNVLMGKRPEGDRPGGGKGPGSSGSGPGVAKDTVGAGSMEGLQGGSNIKSGQQMAKQNKRKLRIQKKTVKV